MTWADAFRPLRNSSFGWYFASRAADTLGSMMSGVALAFAVLAISGAATMAISLATLGSRSVRTLGRPALSPSGASTP